MNPLFSAENRLEVLREMAANPMDLLIIGGGITGAGIAWDASLRGMNAGLIEMNDFASGTSSKSTKLIHGGLRYLKQGEIRLVMEVGRERAILHRLAPHLVVAAPMLLPIYKGGTYGYLASSFGVYIYDMLAGVKRRERRKMFNKQETMRLEPLLKTEGLLGGCSYYEYRTDDARLTIEIMKSAHSAGAKIVNYAMAKELLYENDKLVGIQVEDIISKQVFKIYAKRIVNAAGPWVDKLRELDKSRQGKKLLLTKGVHLVVDQSKLPIKQAAYLDTADGRMIFVIPRGKKTYIGTTDTVYEGDITEPRTTVKDRDYLLQAVNASFPGVRLLAEDVESNWAGLRPLIYEEGKKPSDVSRKEEMFVSASGLISIAGGKLTGFRKMAEKVVDLVAKQLHNSTSVKYSKCSTDQHMISGADSIKPFSYEDYAERLMKQGIVLGIELSRVQYLLNQYGSNVHKIYDYFIFLRTLEATSALAEPVEELLLKAELTYSIKHEMTACAVDFLLRRTGLIYFDHSRAEAIVAHVVNFMTNELQWSEAEAADQLYRVNKEIMNAVKYTSIRGD